ncbi:zinc finger BED domain-containing protein 5-like [Penaeus vannamei]|uniref:zinc finger BED domain-containing protein 5-like n=1 Tax=Penaeus vannamei TaxID=6689 RepID=UPI00387F9F49
MSSDIEKTVSEQMNDKMYALQADESIDIGGISQLLVFTRYIADNKINEKFLISKRFRVTIEEGKPTADYNTLLRRENVIAKTHGQGLKRVLESAVKMVNSIRSRPQQTRLFHSL